MTPKERADFALSRVNRWLLAGNREVAAYHIEQAMIAAENQRAMEEREACARICDKMVEQGAISIEDAARLGVSRNTPTGYAAKEIARQIRARSNIRELNQLADDAA